MADEKHATNDELRQILIGAIAAAPPLTGIQPGVWIGKVNEAIPFVAAMLSDDSYAMRQAREVATAQVFIGVYQSHQLEPAKAGSAPSMRLIVTFKSEREPAEAETIRTHRTDSSKGKAMQARLDKLSPGDRVVLYKAFEEITSGANAGRKARTLVHFETLPPRNDGSAPQTGRSGTPIPDQTAAAPAPPPPDPPAPPAGGGGGANHDPDFGPAPAQPPPSGGGQAALDEELVARLNALPNRIKVPVVRRLRESGIEYPCPQVDKIAEFIAIIDAEEATDRARNPADG